MAQDPKRRQQKLERRKAKQKAQRRELARHESRGMAGKLQQASAAPVLHCFATTDVWDQGIGYVVISRLLPNGTVAFVAFLVDIYCLGVKNVMMDVAPRSRYEEGFYRKVTGEFTSRPLKPECARKLVEGAVDYAMDLGFSPHPDCRAARMIFGDISAEACTERYVYGKDGKPFFMSGPYDGPAKCRNIIHTLENRCGPKGFHFLMPLDPNRGDLDDLELVEEEDSPDQGLLPP
jgi:hypothetical protein